MAFACSIKANDMSMCWNEKYTYTMGYCIEFLFMYQADRHWLVLCVGINTTNNFMIENNHFPLKIDDDLKKKVVNVNNL